jgi:hypothetical protein
LAATGYGADLDPDVSYILVKVSGEVNEFGTWYGSGNAYKIEIR